MFTRGFKSWCENVALQQRRELTLHPIDPLDPRTLAEHLNILVWKAEEVPGLDPKVLLPNTVAAGTTMNQLPHDPAVLRQQLEYTLSQEYPIYQLGNMIKDGLIRMFKNNMRAHSWKSEYLFKLRGSKYEMNIIDLAGDCAVSALSEVLSKGEHKGFGVCHEDGKVAWKTL